MSKQLTLSAALSAAATLAVVLWSGTVAPGNGSARGATAHGSVIGVLLA
jgi:hypothetical protein